jgi:hypothetical protein
MLVKCNILGNGPGPKEKIVSISTKDGQSEEVILSEYDLDNGYLDVGFALATEGDCFLVELPREAASGKWRIWVPESQTNNHKMQHAAE